MTVGPALSGSALDGPGKEGDVQEEILETLKLVLEELKANTGEAPVPR